MKVNIENGEISGYLNCSVSLPVDNSSCTEILAPYVVNKIDYKALQDVLLHWFSKLRIGGTMKLGGYDLIEFSKKVVHSEIPMQQRQELVSASACFLSLHEVVVLVESCGFKVLKKQLEGIHYLVELTKV
jgi:hypothetical protein